MRGTARSLARRYARALFDTASREGEDAPLALRDELRAFAPLLTENAELRQALLHPGLGTEPRRRVLAALAERAGASVLLRRLVDILATRDRIALLPDIALAYADVANTAREARLGRGRLRRGSDGGAVPRARGGARRARRARRVAQPRRPALIGGLLVTGGRKTYDWERCAHRLAALRRRLAATGPGAARAS